MEEVFRFNSRSSERKDGVYIVFDLWMHVAA